MICKYFTIQELILYYYELIYCYYYENIIVLLQTKLI
jgi:hypothetical protein